MSALEENIKRVNGKLQQLLRQYQLLQKENEQLKTLVLELKNNHERDSSRIVELEQQAGILKSAAGKMNEADKKFFQKTIDLYNKEIDNCIGLLSE